MNLTLERSALLGALTRVSGIVSRKATIPILSSILIDCAKDGRVVIRSTNLDMEATVTIAGDVKKPGHCCVSADTLTGIAKNAADGADIHLELKERLIVKSGRSRFQIAVSPADQFPVFSGMTPDVSFTLPPAELHRLVTRVSFCMSEDASRYMMRGVCLSSREGLLCGAATDGKRMSLAEQPTDIAAFSAIIPASMVAEIGRLLDGASETISVGVSASKIMVTAPGIEITSKLVDGEFPNVWHAIPKEFPNVAGVSRDFGLAAARRASIVIDDKDRTSRLIIAQGSMSITARASQADEAEDAFDVEYGGPDINIGVKSTYFMDALVACSAEGVEMAFCEEFKLKPIRFRAVGDDGWAAYIMPLVV